MLVVSVPDSFTVDRKKGEYIKLQYSAKCTLNKGKNKTLGSQFLSSSLEGELMLTK